MKKHFVCSFVVVVDFVDVVRVAFAAVGVRCCFGCVSKVLLFKTT